MVVRQSDAQSESMLIFIARISILGGHDTKLGFQSTIESLADDSLRRQFLIMTSLLPCEWSICSFLGRKDCVDSPLKALVTRVDQD